MSELKKITEPGTYDVTIQNPHFELMDEKNGDAKRMQCVLRGVTDKDLYIDAYLFFTKSIISGGQNRGKTAYQVAMEKLTELGISEPFSPSKIDELEGIQCQFVVQEEEYKGETKLKVQFINTSGRKKLDAREANSIWKSFTGETVPDPATDTEINDLGVDDSESPEGSPF
jgi:hypothetical protein